MVMTFLDSSSVGHIPQFGSGALNGKMLLLRIIENNKIDAYLRTC